MTNEDGPAAMPTQGRSEYSHGELMRAALRLVESDEKANGRQRRRGWRWSIEIWNTGARLIVRWTDEGGVEHVARELL